MIWRWSGTSTATDATSVTTNPVAPAQAKPVAELSAASAKAIVDRMATTSSAGWTLLGPTDCGRKVVAERAQFHPPPNRHSGPGEASGAAGESAG